MNYAFVTLQLPPQRTAALPANVMSMPYAGKFAKMQVFHIRKHVFHVSLDTKGVSKALRTSVIVSVVVLPVFNEASEDTHLMNEAELEADMRTEDVLVGVVAFEGVNPKRYRCTYSSQPI
jgi:hypothetical protein